MSDRDRLIEILKVPIHPKIGVDPAEVVADYLIANGVFLLPEDLRGTEDFSVSAFIEAMKMHKEKDRYIKTPCKVGTRHNNLTFIAVDDIKTKEKCRPYYILRCDCGNIKSVRKDLWESGNTKACGCLYETHGQAKGQHARIYNIFHGMKKRCYNKNSKGYKYYGGRGIKVCDEWLNDFTVFYNWAIKNGYQEHLTIDRIDVNGDYCPENCRWITMAEQQRNKRTLTKEEAEQKLKELKDNANR